VPYLACEDFYFRSTNYPGRRGWSASPGLRGFSAYPALQLRVVGGTWSVREEAQWILVCSVRWLAVGKEAQRILVSSGALWKKLLSPFHHPHLTSRNSVFETPGEKTGGSRAAPTTQAILEPPVFSPGVLKTELREVKCG
jgi:hypothetical protein